ncbi:MAG: hypothetical protein GX547_16120, partial [Phycisphaerae bacterium]|nr:hypothetical protein [Phycisphaerae bacterium]
GTQTFAYDPSSLALATETFGIGLLSRKVITHLYAYIVARWTRTTTTCS